MKRRHRLSAFVLLLFPLLLLGAGAFLLSERGLNGVVRPRLESVLSARLGGEVLLGRLELGRGRLAAEGLVLRREGRWRMEVPRLEADFTLRGLLGRRLERLRLESPEGRFERGGEGGMPERPPLTIGRLEVVGGQATVRAAGRDWRVGAIALEGTLADTSPFRLSLRLGEGEGVPAELRGRLAWGKTPALTLEGARWEGRELLAAPLTATFPEEGGSAGGALVLDSFDDRRLGRVLDVFELKNPLPEGTGFSLASLRLGFRREGEDLALELSAREGAVSAGGRKIPFRELRAKGGRRGEAWEGEGSFLLAGTAPLRVRGRYADERLAGALSLDASDPVLLLRQLAGVSLPEVEGGAVLDAEVTAAPGKALVAARLRGTRDLSLFAADLTLRREGESLSGKGALRLRGREMLRGEGTPGRMTVELRPADGRDLALLLPSGKRPAALLSAQGVAGRAELVRGAKGWRGRADLRARRLSAAEGVTGKVEIAGGGEGWSGRADLRAKRLAAGKAVLEDLRLAGRFARSGEKTVFREGRVSARLSGEGLPSARLSAAGEGELAGRDFRLRFERFSAGEVEYLSADGTAGLTGGRVTGSGTVEGRLGGKLRLDLSASLGLAEALKGAFYANLREIPAGISLKGTFDPGEKRLEAEDLKLRAPGIGRAGLRGFVAPGRAALAGAVEHPDLREALGRLRTAAGEALPALREVSAAGAIRSDLEFSLGSAGWRARGTAFPRGLDLDWPGKKLALAGASGEIPFDLGPGAPAGAGERPGRLAFSRLVLGPAVLAGDSVRLRSGPNRAALDTLLFRLAGGELEIADPAVDLAGKGFAASLAVREASLEELSRALGLPEMAGSLSADLGRIRLEKGTLTTEGEMAVDVFGGRIRVRNLRLESLFTKYPTCSADAEFAGIDLRQLTRTLAFGEINGVADGYVRELRLFGKVPSRFEALLETRPKGTRNISVKALRNLTTISQGGIGAVLSRGVYRFIDFYRYRRIGLYCSLKNDVFVLRGTARDGSGRYLVDGGLLPPKINIIAPEHAISFKEMIKRLQRMERADSKPAESLSSPLSHQDTK